MGKILVIEDEPQMRRNIMTILELEGHQTVGAENGRVGLALAREHQPDLIFCDITMPDVDGYDVLRSLRADPDPATAALPFVFLTAKGEKTDLGAGMNIGADGYLTKPVILNDLLTAIRVRIRTR
jgi:CheY-like chemotaxis protein